MMIVIATGIARADDTGRALDPPTVTTAAMTATGKVAEVAAAGTLVAATAAEVAAGTREAPVLLTTARTVTAGQFLYNRFPLVYEPRN
jgi:hypothetical protein